MGNKHINILRLIAEIMNFIAIILGFYSIIHVSVNLQEKQKKQEEEFLSGIQRSKNFAIAALSLYVVAFIIMSYVHYNKIFY